MWTSLIGFMGSGKSTLTRRLQASTRRPLVSVDDEVARRTGRSIPEIFQEKGEPAFRDLELEVLGDLDPSRNLVVDTGGGIVHTPEACELLRSRGVVLWLDVAWEVLLRRLRDADPATRPLIGRLGWAGVEELHRRRRPLYAAVADFRLRGDDSDPEGLARTAMLRSLVWERRREGTGDEGDRGPVAGPAAASADGSAVRPTTDRVKEALFNILGPAVDGALVLDLCCGAGGLGIEALSRGARQAIFVDDLAASLEATRRNLEACRAEPASWRTVKADVRAWLGTWAPPEGDEPWILLADPPYRSDLAGAIMEKSAVWSAGPGFRAAAVEVGSDQPDFPDGWETRRYGESTLALLRP